MNEPDERAGRLRQGGLRRSEWEERRRPGTTSGQRFRSRHTTGALGTKHCLRVRLHVCGIALLAKHIWAGHKSGATVRCQEWCYSALSRVVLQCVVFPCWAIPLIHHHLRLCLYLPIPSLPLPGAQRDLQHVLHGGLLLVRSLIRMHLYSSIFQRK